jgi:hypothetical protein
MVDVWEDCLGGGGDRLGDGHVKYETAWYDLIDPCVKDKVDN